ncbi:hypothetical protein MKZ38_006891 [Zalerion maritima]|uniref:Uncharacterized protein n=1 Tax=Zalerion maritima TaxID=339359 RepID=A0AAD5WNI6_9PEZI|nr:hypothetical protein MKZ38_006891 [Zalerion maritima]
MVLKFDTRRYQDTTNVLFPTDSTPDSNAADPGGVRSRASPGGGRQPFNLTLVAGYWTHIIPSNAYLHRFPEQYSFFLSNAVREAVFAIGEYDETGNLDTLFKLMWSAPMRNIDINVPQNEECNTERPEMTEGREWRT